MTTDKENIQALVEICASYELREVVFSPGSRSAPLVIAFSQHPFGFHCSVIPDERVAAFFAMGIAMKAEKPTILVCTSGTAILNYAPAICEAYYQQIPLLVFTADRPAEYIGIGENQAINQNKIYRNYIKSSFTLPTEIIAVAQTVEEAIQTTTVDSFGPVHINIPLAEPLYNQVEYKVLKLPRLPLYTSLDSHTQTITITGKTLLIVGMQEKHEGIKKLAEYLISYPNITVITESLSNIHLSKAIKNIDGVITRINRLEEWNFAPENIITVGKQIVSKRLRNFIKKHTAAYHGHISNDKGEWNGLGAKEYRFIKVDNLDKIEWNVIHSEDSKGYQSAWLGLGKEVDAITENYAENTSFSDFQVFNALTRNFPHQSNIHYGNSSPIRYASFFKHNRSLTINANRGTSGIDGCVSTAAGAAVVNCNLTIAVVGDVSFLYDSNALWNQYLSPNLRIIIINNGGGNIFRLIEGPKGISDFEKYFETEQQYTAKPLAEMYDLEYQIVTDNKQLLAALTSFYQPKNRPAILEIITDRMVNEGVYKKYFEILST